MLSLDNEESEILQPLPEYSQAKVESLVMTLKGAFPSIDAEFERNYSAWKATWSSGTMWLSSCSANHAKGMEWDALVAMTPKILPQVVHKLSSPDDIFAVELYNNLQSDPDKKVPPTDIVTFHEPGLHSQKIIQLYATHIAEFEAHTSAWQAHQKTVQMMSHSSFYLDHPSVDAIVYMGKDQVVPLVMAQYSKRQGGWWHEVLYELKNGTKSGAYCFIKPQLYQQWKKWFETGQ